jgi:hypothetical protein
MCHVGIVVMDVEQLIKSKKCIEKKRRPELKQENRHFRAEIDLKCDLNDVNMTMFIRKHVDVFDNFTVGLKLNTPNPYIDHILVLLRFQGPHGGQSDTREFANLHNRYHIHRYTEEDFLHKRKKASVDSKYPADFSSYEEAVCSFLKFCNIEDTNGIFAREQNAIMQLRIHFPT